MAFTLRTVKGSALTHTELDTNFTNPGYGNFGGASGAVAGEIRASSEITAYWSSDARLKENIKEIDNAINIVVTVGGKTFDWTKEHTDKRGGIDGYYVKKSDFGIIAQDIQAVFPLAVNVKDDNTLAVDYPKLVAVAFAAIKEQQSVIESLKNEILEIKTMINARL